MRCWLRAGGEMDHTTDGTGRLMARDVMDHVTCSLCSGYLIDATTVVGCLHSCKLSCVSVCPLVSDPTSL